jgi:hypothetical protein
MSFLSAQGQTSRIITTSVGAGGANAGVQGTLVSEILPVGDYVFSIMSGVVGSGVTGGTLLAQCDGVVIASTPVGATTIKGTLTSVFRSDGIHALEIRLTGVGGNWTSVATTLYAIPVV